MNGDRWTNDTDPAKEPGEWERYEREKARLQTEGRYEDNVRALCERLEV